MHQKKKEKAAEKGKTVDKVPYFKNKEGWKYI